MKQVIAITACLFVAACTTPTYTLKNPKTGDVETCGGNTTASIAGGILGYHLQKDQDAKCKEILQKNGYKEIK